MKLMQITTDWFYTTEVGEECEIYEPGKNDCTEIKEHAPQGDGDKWYCDIFFTGGRMKRVFNINSISYETEGA